MKRLIPLFVASLVMTTVQGQVSMGHRAGLSIASQRSEKEDFLKGRGIGGRPMDDPHALMGVSSALVVEAMIKPYIGVQLELGITQKGRQISEKNFDQGRNYYRLRLNYGEGLLLLKGTLGKGSVKGNLLGGISFGRGLSAVERGKFSVDSLSGEVVDRRDSASIKELEDRFIDFDDVTKGFLAPTELCWVVGAGVSFDIGRSRIFLEGRFNQGLSAVYNGKLNEPDVFNRAILVQAGYLVRLNNRKEKK
ncbi:MAG TPA: outer membrane beta-barrel protein, partial [Flavobacteriales bacterium]|nr:outer membrane beta-barrel protein [Flavobacteriales bacterium]